MSTPFRSSIGSLAALAAVALAAAAAPAALAQCAPAQHFASIGLAKPGQGAFAQVVVDTSLAEDAGHEIGRFWSAANSMEANNFGGSCPSTNPVASADGWWQPCAKESQCNGGPPTHRGISGYLSGGTCTATSCPNPGAGGDQLVFLVEDWGAGGPPGIGAAAYWVAFRVDGTPAPARLWDLGRVTGTPPVNATLPMRPFPVLQIKAAAKGPSALSVVIVGDIEDLGSGMHSAVGDAGGAPPDSTTVKSYDLCTYFGPTEPGRLRSAGWNCNHSVPYQDAAAVGVYKELECPSKPQGFWEYWWVATGITFHGGAGPDVQSTLVGRAIQISCETLAEPQPRRPGVQRPAPRAPRPRR